MSQQRRPRTRSTLVRMHRRLSRVPGGTHVASVVYRLAATYFVTIPARLVTLEPGRATAAMPRRPWTRNHLGGVHAIALCNLAELVMGAAAEATVPSTHRWIPQAMTVGYPARARGTMYAVATLELPENLSDKGGFDVPVTITDDSGGVVLDGTITIWVTRR